MALVHTESRVIAPVQVNNSLLIPIEKTSRIQPPGMWGALFWHRPSALIVRHNNGTDEVITIQDPTRKAQVILLGLGLLSSILILVFRKFFS